MQVVMDSNIYVQDILNTTMVVVLRGYDMKSRIFIILAFLNKFITYESMLEIVPNNARKSN